MHLHRFIALAVSALLVMGQSPQPPTPLPGRAAPPAYDPNAPRPPPVRAMPGVSGGWQRFQGARRCEINPTTNQLICDNGYKQSVR